MAVDRLRQQLDGLRDLRRDPLSESTVAELRTALAKRPSHVVAAAAHHVAAFELRGLAPDLVRAYDRMKAGDDPGCVAKLALVTALSALDHRDDAPLRHAVGHVQPEKSWGPPIDSAVGLRCEALMALVGLGDPDTPLLVADMLADPEPRCRSAAARCAAAWGEPIVGRALLQLRIRAGEADPDVLGDCFEAMLALGAPPDEITKHLDGSDVVSESAALALGAARADAALPALIDWWRLLPGQDSRRVALVAIGLLRSQAALAFLLEQLAKGSKPDARTALEALAVFLPDPAAVPRIREAAHEARLDAEFEQRLAER